MPRHNTCRWNGIPRHVLERAQDRSYQLEMEDMLSQVDMQTLLAAASNHAAAGKASSKLLHTEVSRCL